MNFPDIASLRVRRVPLIGDRWIEHASGGERELIDPNRGVAVAVIRLAGPQEIDQAVTVAAAAQIIWIGLPAPRRRDMLQRWLTLIRAADADLALMGALESGIPIGSALGPLAHAWFEYYAGWADRIEGAVTAGHPTPGFNYTLKEPFGVVGVIIPWNAPLVAIAMTCAPALAAGNALVLKPPANTPFVALKLGELALEAGLPPGVFNVLPGDAGAGQSLVRNPAVAKVCFTGGGEIARSVLNDAALTLKPVFLELGGKSPNLVFEDADIDAAVPMAVYSSMGLAGQGCVLPTRMLVQRSIYQEVMSRLRALLPTLKTGVAYDASSVVGPIISQSAGRRILGIIDRARESGDGELIAGGARLRLPNNDGFFIEPTVFAGVNPQGKLARTEVFGPVLAVLPFDSEAEAVRIANDIDYGLGAYLQTRDLNRAMRVAARLQAGYVTVNGFPAMNPNAPFGGYKRSGFGRLGGREGLEEYLQTKNVFVTAGR